MEKMINKFRVNILVPKILKIKKKILKINSVKNSMIMKNNIKCKLK